MKNYQFKKVLMSSMYGTLAEKHKLDLRKIIRRK